MMIFTNKNHFAFTIQDLLDPSQNKMFYKEPSQNLGVDLTEWVQRKDGHFILLRYYKV